MNASPILTPLYDPANGVMQVAGFMSGSGTNLVKLIEHSKRDRSYVISVIFTDQPTTSNAIAISDEYKVPLVSNNKSEFLAPFLKGRIFKNIPKEERKFIREQFDRRTLEKLSPYKFHMIALGGYMSIASDFLIDSYLLVNVHPADLSVTGADGKRKYTGDDAVQKAILAGERELRATTHIIDKGPVDGCRIFMISDSIKVNLPHGFDPTDKPGLEEIAKQHQKQLKEVGDWDIFPRTLEYIAKGRFSKNPAGLLYLDRRPIPNGDLICN